MTLRNFVTAAVLVCLATTAVAQLSGPYTDWGHGPLQFLLTKEEAATWKTIRTDADAKAFVDLFWARRDPAPNTPENEFRDQIESRIQYADEHFVEGKVRGALTDRGKTLILFGVPQKAERSAAPNTIPGFDSGSARQRNQDQVPATIQWTYEAEDARAIFDAPRAQFRFIDRLNADQFKLDRGRVDFAKAQQRAIDRSITQPNLTVAPAAVVAAPAPVAAPVAPAAPVVVTALTTEAFKAAVAEAKSAKNPYKGAASWGEFVTSYGETFVPVGIYIPKSAGLTGPDVTFFGVVEDASGTSVLAFEEPTKVTETKGDSFVDKSVQLAAGKYRGTFGVAQNGKVVSMATTDMELTGAIDKDATAVSPLILSNNIFPLTEAQGPTDPFAFGGVRVIPKSDRTFRPSDELWYFFELRNPGLAEAALPEGTVPVNAGEAPKQMPKIQVKLDVVGKDKAGAPVKMAAPPRETDAIEMKGVPGHYGVGNAIPLTSFKPGDYTFTVKIIDTVKKASYTLSEKFKVVE